MQVGCGHRLRRVIRQLHDDKDGYNIVHSFYLLDGLIPLGLFVSLTLVIIHRTCPTVNVQRHMHGFYVLTLIMHDNQGSHVMARCWIIVFTIIEFERLGHLPMTWLNPNCSFSVGVKS